MKENVVIIAVDGGVRNNQSENNIGAYGAILHYNERKKYVSMGFRNVTNNQMEIRAVIAGLKEMKRYDLPIEVHCDSAYVVNSINNKWLDGWAKSGWIKKDGKKVKNMELWQELLELIRAFDNLIFVKVKGHSDNELNNEVDRLVNLEMDNIK